MPQILMSHPRTRLIIAGSGPLETQLRRLAADLGSGAQVEFLGMIGQAALPDLYRRATLFVSPFVVAKGGDQEGLGLVLVEAAGCGCPLVCGHVSAVTDVVTHGETGVLVAPPTSGAFADAINGLLADPHRQRRLAANALQHCRAAFDWTAVAQRYSQLLLRFAANRSAG